MDKKNINEEFDLIDISGNDFVEELTIEEPNVKANISNAEVKTEGNLSGKLDDNLNTNNSKVSDSVSPSTTSGEPVSSNENVNNNSTNNGYSPESIPKENVQSENNNANNSRNSNIPNNTNNNFGPNRNSLNKQNNLPENNDSNNNLNSTPNTPQDNRSLKDKTKDAKDKINDTKDKIKNAPENIKNKIDDTKNKINNAKDKVNNAKDKIKNAPDNLKQKRDQVKDKWNNRPKNMKEAGNRAKDSLKSAGKGIKSKAKSGLKKGATKAKEKAKDSAKEAFNNTSVGQAVNKVKEVRDLIATSAKMMKKIISFLVKTFPYLEIAIGVILMIIVIATFAAYLMPGLFGDVNDSSKYEQYSKVDQKTLEEIRSIFASHPNADATLAMATVLYPYYSNLHDGNVTVYLKGISDSDNIEDTSEDSDDSSSKVGTDIENEDENEEIDFYLLPFRNSKVKGRLKDLLAGMGASGDNTTFESYVKDEYFKKDKGFTLYYDKEILTGYNGYKNMFKSLNDSANEDALEDAIIKELYDIKDMFINYVFENVVCSSSLIDAGTVEVSDILKTGVENIYVDVKEESCTTSNAENIKNCGSWHDSPILLEEYVKGVVNTEISVDENTPIDKIKTQMIMAKSVVMGRYKEMGWDITQNDDGTIVIPIRANTNDQDYCDYKEGCSGKSSGNEHPAASTEVQQLYDIAWDETINEYIYDKQSSRTVSYYKTEYDKYCVEGACLISRDFDEFISDGLNYTEIISSAFPKYSFITIEPEGYANIKISGEQTCVALGSNGGGISDDNFKFYYQTDYASAPFCGTTNHTNSCSSGSNSICSSGCGVTSLAMIVENLSTDNITFDPIAANEEAIKIGGCAVGSGSYGSLFTGIASNHPGFTAETLTSNLDGASKAIETLKNGGLVAANVQMNSPFTSGGHWILLRGLTKDGKVKVADPNSKERSLTGKYNIEDFINKNWFVDANGTTHSWIAIYGPRSEEIKKLFIESSSSSGEIIDEESVLKADFVAPIQDYTLKMYGKNSANGNTNHDLGASCGSSVYAPAAGAATFKTVHLNGKIFGYGNIVEIVTNDGYKFVLSHLKSFVGYNVSFGSASTYPSSCVGKNCSTYIYGSREVAKAEKIGVSGTSGNSSGCHLHIELYKNGKRLEPSKYLGYEVR